MDKLQNNHDLGCREGGSYGLKDFSPNKGAGFKRKVCQTPFSMGLTQIPTPIEKAVENPKSLRLAINAKCFDCMGCGFDGHPANEIRNCEISDCSLWPHRPYRKKKRNKPQSSEVLK